MQVELGKPKVRAWSALKGTRQGVMLHYDASTSDKGGLAWLEDDGSVQVSYHFYILDNGRIIQICPPGFRSWHAGACKPSSSKFTYSDGNSAFYGVSIAAKDGDKATDKQVEAVVELCHYLFWLEDWSEKETWRITGHDAEAWPRGRKPDPKGTHPVPVLSVEHVRTRFAATTWQGIP